VVVLICFTTAIFSFLKTHQKALVVSKDNHSIIKILKKKLTNHAVEFFCSPILPNKIELFDYIFFINEKLDYQNIIHLKKKKIIYIFLDYKKSLKLKIKKEASHIKIITINGSPVEDVEIDKILWFSFSNSKESHLNIRINKPLSTQPTNYKNKTFILSKYLTKKFIIILFILGFFVYHLLYIPPLLRSTWLIYTSYKTLGNNKNENVENLLNKASKNLNLSKQFYSLSRPTFLLFNLALPSDSLLDINQRGNNIIRSLLSISTDAKIIQQLLFNKNKTEQEKTDLTLRLTQLSENVDLIKDNISTITQQIPSSLFALKKIKTNFIEAVDYLTKFKKLIVYTQKILKSPEEKKYLIQFANNRELRPGGGFLGSFAIVKIKNQAVNDLKIYDVYDADGQLNGHIEPPSPIKKYLNLPHWFLRDSNFSPDFIENYQKALLFLEKEINETGFSGGALLTTSAIENLLNAFPTIYLPDYKEAINSKNFYLKTQDNVETNFFPGSTQKRTFLNSLINQLILNLENVSYKDFVFNLKKSLDEKQIVLFFEDQDIQTFIDSSYWSGRVISPICTVAGKNCLLDYIFPYDANLGANKANYYINRFLDLKTKISEDGRIDHILSIQYKNLSPDEFFHTGYYRNYFQILLPVKTTIKSITKDGVVIENNEIDQKDSQYKMIGFYLEIAPKKTVDIKINYSLNDLLKKGSNIYQLVFQKQIGANNSDLILQFEADSSFSFLNQNFSPIVNDQKIIYNTSLSTDKIFLIELIKQ